MSIEVGLRSAQGALWTGFKLTALLAGASTFFVGLSIWGRPSSIDDQVRYWILYFAPLTAVAFVRGLFGRRDIAIAIALFGGLLLATAWFWGPSLLAMLHGVRADTPVPPVRS
jgi:hypothetical protein